MFWFHGRGHLHQQVPNISGAGSSNLNPFCCFLHPCLPAASSLLSVNIQSPSNKCKKEILLSWVFQCFSSYHKTETWHVQSVPVHDSIIPTHIHKSIIVFSYEIRLELCQHQHPNFSVLLSSLACSACMIFDLLNAAGAFHVSSDKEQVVSVVSGIMLPIYEGFRLSHYKDPYETTSNYNGKKQRFWTLLMYSASGCASKSMTT